VPATPAQRFGYIDAQRGLAALLVIWLHATDAFMQLPTPPAGGQLYKISAAIDTGRIGVILFFAISELEVYDGLSPFRMKPHALESLLKFLAGDLGSWRGYVCPHAGTRLVSIQAP
jgi:hypothetical protein